MRVTNSGSDDLIFLVIYDPPPADNGFSEQHTNSSSSAHPRSLDTKGDEPSKHWRITMSGRFQRAATIGTVALAAPLIAATSGVPSKLAPIHGPYNPSIDPAKFVRTIDNRYLPFIPGTGYHFEGVRGKTPQTDDEVVTHRTKRILGIRCTVVRDTVSEQGKPVERTFDYYAQDKQGNVWYMGELSLEKRHGRLVKASDSWQAGVNGGKPGIIMPAHPKRGDAYRQEYYPPGQALDEARVIGYGGSVTVPDGTFKRPLVTLERSPLEPQAEKKYYVAGIGEVKERAVKGHHEAFQLVSVTH
jgi:hypothetical protein